MAGRRAQGDNFHVAGAFDIKPMLRPGVNVLAVAAENGGTTPNPAGLIGALVVKFRDGHALTVHTDKNLADDPDCPRQLDDGRDAAGDWSAAMELGPMGMAPWGTVEKPAAEPDVFCDFSVVSGLLGKLGVPPDFESDGPLRYTHRRDGQDRHLLCRQPRGPPSGGKLHFPSVRQNAGAVGPVDRPDARLA